MCPSVAGFATHATLRFLRQRSPSCGDQIVGDFGADGDTIKTAPIFLRDRFNDFAFGGVCFITDALIGRAA